MHFELFLSISEVVAENFTLGHKERFQESKVISWRLVAAKKQDAVQSYEAVVEIKVDHQSCYNLIVCCYILGQVEKMKGVFTKMLLVKHYNSDDSDDDIDGDHNSVLRVCICSLLLAFK